MPLSRPTASQRAELGVPKHRLREAESMNEVSIIRVDLKTNLFQLHGAATDLSVLCRK